MNIESPPIDAIVPIGRSGLVYISEATQVLPGRLGFQGDAELALKPPIVEADGGERLDGGVSQCQLSSYRDDKVQVTEAHVCS